jgi:myo-inositol 2-dehydrogenase/D-chiro-inositol 1-dehydrogenase
MKMQKRIKIGVIGCGKQAQDTHIPNLISIPEAKLVALADVDEHRLRGLGELYNVEKVFPNYSDLLKEDLDAVVICTPTSTHATISEEAAKMGKHIFVEKPMATSSIDAERVLKLTDVNQVKLMVGFQMRFLPNHLKVREMIRQGQIGRLLAVEMHSETLQIKPDDGILLDYGTHFFDLLRWYNDGGSVVSVSATLRETESTQCAMSTITFADGLTAIVDLYWVPAYRSWERVERYSRFIGDRGKIMTDQSSSVVRIYKPGTVFGRLKAYQQIMLPFAIHPSIPISATTYRKEMEEFINAILEGRAPSVSGFDGLMAIRIAEAARESSQKGTTMRLA